MIVSDRGGTSFTASDSTVLFTRTVNSTSCDHYGSVIDTSLYSTRDVHIRVTNPYVSSCQRAVHIDFVDNG